MRKGAGSSSNGARGHASGDDALIREEIRQAFMSIRGMLIDEVYPPFGQDPAIPGAPADSLAQPIAPDSDASRGANRRTQRREVDRVRRKRRVIRGSRANSRMDRDEAAITEELLRGIMSARDLDVEDVYSSPNTDEEVRS